MIYLSCDNMKKIIYLISIFFIGINLVSANSTVKFNKCIDGDTFKATLDGKVITIRMLAVDTPELAKEDKAADYYANEASDYTCNRLKQAKKITLEYDANSDKQDKYDRYLAWVFLDGDLLQTDLVENGYAKVAYLYNDYKYTDILIQKQEIASAKNIGIWNSSKENNETDNEKYENIEVIIISILFLIFIFISKKIFK